MDWKQPSEYAEERGAYPNRLVMLTVVQAWNETMGDSTPLVDAEQGTPWVTMGHWMPEDGSEPGHWVAVGWDWDQDCFVEDRAIKVVMWAEMPAPWRK